MQKLIKTTAILLISSIIFSSTQFFGQKVFAQKDTLVNWGGNQRCTGKIFYPKTQEEVRAILQQARQEKKTVRAYGTAHSWSDILCADYIINTDSFNKILHVDKERNLVTVEGGIKLHDLNRELAKRNLALPNIGAQAAQSIVGATATATHGSGKTSTMADFIQQITLITADGKTHILSKDEHPEYFAAARTSIGSLGFIYAVTVQCVPLFKLKHTRRATDWNTLKKEYKSLRENNDYFWFFINPYTDQVLVYLFNKTHEPITTINNYWQSMKDKFFISRMLGTVWVKLLEAFPKFTPTFTNLFYAGAQRKDQVDYGYNILVNAHTSSREAVYQGEEIALPVEHLEPALEDVKALLRKYTQKNFYVFMWGVLVRFVLPDTHNYLSPATDRDTVYISVTSSWIDEEFYKEFQDLMLKYQGRPHWGKINFVDNTLAQKLYGDNIRKFIEVRKQLDPDTIFSNSFTKRVLGS